MAARPLGKSGKKMNIHLISSAQVSAAMGFFGIGRLYAKKPSVSLVLNVV
jgi:hypothetical protein